ncbi:hypothetical protein M407DRAFT_14718 [Tulasnella calospora MUT 4182]|uniref:UV excision repair protein RAD23 n=1 Tax=Tulasnella calospora MUT 4182 TaxID=1051891 RepID=A0A0C3M453_9AGAM|nr:hypothetical protein M407DRAFT_14718 [Tulasnella calospora MUT 4182]
MTLSITVKTLQQKQFKVDAEPSDTVLQLKEKIEATNGAPIANQKLVYAGKILADEKTVEECNIKEKDFLVLMVSKPKPAPAPAASTPTTSASTSTPAPATSVPPLSDQVPPAPVPAPAEPAIQPPAQPTATGTTTETTASSTLPPAEMPAFGDMSAFVTGGALQTSINNLVEMGFPRDQVLAAMRASYNNPDRAVEYLMNGIPEHLQAEARVGAPSTTAPTSQAPAPQTPSTAPSAPTVQQQAPAQPGNLFQAAQQAAQQQGGPGAGRGPGSAGAGGPPLNLAALQNNPMMDQIRQMVQQNPALIQPLLQNLVQTNPELAGALAANPDLLMQLLGAGGAGGEGMEGDDDDGPIPPGAQVINVTPEERDAIDRLVQLGFPREAAIQAYFACDKNEELAANYLFENGFE